MSAYTKQAIKNSFLKLLNERPLSRVTVKAIVDGNFLLITSENQKHN